MTVLSSVSAVAPGMSDNISSDVHMLEMKYREQCQNMDELCHTERDRQSRIITLLLQEENFDLRTQLVQDDERICQMRQCLAGVRQDMKTVVQSLESANVELCVRARQIETLKAELHSLQEVTMDSTKLLTEKLALARMVSSMKPEMEHLQSQAASNQSLLTEKLSLQRQLSTAQVELEDEKRLSRRTIARADQAQVQDADLEERLEQTLGDLAREKRERQSVEKEAERKCAEMQKQTTVLQSRLEGNKTRLKSMKGNLEEAERKYQQALERSTYQPNADLPPIRQTKTSSKRTFHEANADTMIGTPGDQPVTKRGRSKMNALGEKSTFSITPFLSRTTNICTRDDDPTITDAREAANGGKSSRPQHRPSVPKRPDYDMQENPTDEGPIGSYDCELSQAGPEVALDLQMRNHITLDTNPSNVDQIRATDLDGSGAAIAPSRFLVADTYKDCLGQKSRKKRRLLGQGTGKTLFDDDDEDDRRAIELGGSRVTKRSGKGIVIGSRSRSRAVGEFGQISPLKKDR